MIHSLNRGLSLALLNPVHSSQISRIQSNSIGLFLPNEHNKPIGHSHISKPKQRAPSSPDLCLFFDLGTTAAIVGFPYSHAHVHRCPAAANGTWNTQESSCSEFPWQQHASRRSSLFFHGSASLTLMEKLKSWQILNCIPYVHLDKGTQPRRVIINHYLIHFNFLSCKNWMNSAYKWTRSEWI